MAILLLVGLGIFSNLDRSVEAGDSEASAQKLTSKDRKSLPFPDIRNPASKEIDPSKAKMPLAQELAALRHPCRLQSRQ
ncbi:MAG: hypothetical protein CMJ77_02145 [Planctomycetaceae bacterium]|nr:hypothetical protein [Planctomycetaceae bacterium]